MDEIHNKTVKRRLIYALIYSVCLYGLYKFASHRAAYFILFLTGFWIVAFMIYHYHDIIKSVDEQTGLYTKMSEYQLKFNDEVDKQWQKMKKKKEG